MDFQVLVCLFLSIQVALCLDSLELLNPPLEPQSNLRLKVQYSCDGPSTVQLDCVVSFDTGAVSTFLLKKWTCDPGGLRSRAVTLVLPDWLVYQPDGIVPDSQWVLSCILRASVRHADETVSAQDAASLQPRPVLSRPLKQHQLCFPWSEEVLKLTARPWRIRCGLEEETVHFLSGVFASTGENFGVTKTLQPYTSAPLEYSRVASLSFPWCMFSVWVFVTRNCEDSLCSVFHHIDSLNNYATPALFLKASGHLHVQVSGDSQGSSAYVTPFTVPLSQWCHISVKLHGRAVAVSLLCEVDRTRRSTEYMLKQVYLDDTNGYFVTGGGKYTKGVDGYLGPFVYYRNRIPPHGLAELEPPDAIRSLDLTGWLQRCSDFKMKMNSTIRFHSRSAEPDSCFDLFHGWVSAGTEGTSKSQCPLWESGVRHTGSAAKLVALLVQKHGGRRVDLPALGRALYTLSLHKLRKASDPGVLAKMLPLLLQAGCLGASKALRVSSVLCNCGLSIRKQPEKARLLVLLAAREDDRLALLQLGHLHHLGLRGAIRDPDVSYAYYSNIASQTILDRHHPSPQQAFVEEVYLNNEEVLKAQTNEDHHIFQWLRHQARSGAVEAEQTIARMLFWGQQGVSSNIQRAVRHFERGAIRWGDPVSMYDYGITLLLGHGVDKDIPKALIFLRRAMDKGYAPAFNALAWYYEQFGNDFEEAVRLWEEADRLGSPDAALNLGVLYSTGRYPGQAADQFMAFKYYLKSAERGHLRGAVQLADIWTTGIPGSVDRRPSDAVLWVKWAAEQNGYMGTVLRSALDSYLKKDMLGALFYYMLTAEMGFAPAQFNMAYLCEQNEGGFLDPAFRQRCMARYYNITIQSQNPEPYALIRMGDLWYEGRVNGRKDLFFAAEMYMQAALRKEPQGWHNLGLLAEDGYKMPLSMLIELGLSELHMAENSRLPIALYKRCRDSESSDSYLPCSLALVSLYLHLFQTEYRDVIKYCTAMVAITVPTVVFVVVGLLRRRTLSRNLQL
ncbi:protein sel-1 homolog 3 [Neosynchiropus ocellatus]